MIHIFCPNCRATYNDEKLNFCLECGTKLDAVAVEFMPPLNDDTPTIVSLPPAKPIAKKSSLPLILGAIFGVVIALTLGAAAVIGIYLSQTPKRAEMIPPISSPTPKKDAATPKPSPSASPTPTKAVSPVPTSSPKNLADESFNIKTSASSVRKPDSGNFYNAENAFDGKMTTAWCEGAAGAGIGESLQFKFSREVQLNAVTIYGGYFKNREAWSKNNRLAQAELEFSDGTTQIVSFPNAMEAQSATFENVKTSLVKIKILKVYPGAADSEDTLISEVYFNLR